MPGARRTRSLACKVEKAHEHSHHRSTESPGISLRNGVTVCFALSPVTGLFCHRRRADNSAKLDASVGASGPHDFAVRNNIVRLRAGEPLTSPKGQALRFPLVR